MKRPRDWSIDRRIAVHSGLGVLWSLVLIGGLVQFGFYLVNHPDETAQNLTLANSIPFLFAISVYAVIGYHFNQAETLRTGDTSK